MSEIDKEVNNAPENETPQDKQPRQRYSLVARFFHWTVAVLVLFQFLKFGDRIADGAHLVGELIKPYHGSIGFIILIFMIARVITRLKDKSVRPAVSVKAKLGHYALYFFGFAMPITGAMYVVGKGYGLKVFGAQIISGGDGIGWMTSVGSLHSACAILFAALVTGHTLIALYHHFVEKSDSLKRMV